MADRFAKLSNEAKVELRVLVPLFEQLGYDPEDVSPKHPAVFQEGRAGRKHEADFVLFASPLHNRETSLVVVEAKSPFEDLEEGRRQAESYALATRAPILVTCDGQTFEMWQLNLARSSDKILSFPVAEIDGRQGELERYLRKQVVIEYCRTVCGKTIVEATADFGPYEDAELRRTLSFERAIDRRLKNLETDNFIGSRSLAESAPSGAVIVAASGLGKTNLGYQLFRELVGRRWRDPSGPIPVHVPILDVQPDETILSFAVKRLAPYNASVTGRSIVSFIRENGLVLVIDTFDRLDDTNRTKRESELRLLLRDHANLSTFVLSRVSAKPNLVLPTYEIAALDEKEKLAILQMRGIMGSSTLMHLMPPLLRELCDNPLILNLAVDYHKNAGAYPARIEQIFRAWLDRTIQSDTRTPADVAKLEIAFGVLAGGKPRGRKLATEVVSALEQAGLASQLFNELVRCDALLAALIHGGSRNGVAEVA